MAVINGFVEEFFWRGMYLLQFRKSVVIGMVVAPLLFAAYHIALWYVKGITYQGGIFALVGGAYVMGLLWSWVSRKTGTIFSVTIAHILVNVFAFTGLFVENGF
jgi:membrane protease YdiL (CAAX protease family)